MASVPPLAVALVAGTAGILVALVLALLLGWAGRCWLRSRVAASIVIAPRPGRRSAARDSVIDTRR